MNLELIMATMEHFHHCTHLPVRLFTNLSTTSEIYHFGCSSIDLGILKKYCSNELLTELIGLLPKQNIIHHALSSDIYLTLCLVNTEEINSGAFVIGPYTTKADSETHLVFKPLHCMHHLVHLLDIIKADRHLSFTTTNDITFFHHPLDTPKFDEHSYHVTKAKAYIEKNYYEPLTLQQLADYLGINKSYFCTIFKKVTKQSFSPYINNLRIEKSKELLIDTNDSILEIALATGFSSASYFNNIFKKVVGMTPVAYRQAHKKDT